MSTPPPATPDTTDWSFVIHATCTECGYQPHDPRDSAQRLLAAGERWHAVLLRDDASTRPSPHVWSPVEYACHVRDMVRLLGERVDAMVSGDHPTFDNWDSEVVAVERDYWAVPLDAIAQDLAATTRDTVRVLDGLDDQSWGRAGRRSDGEEFTVEALCRYLVHEVEHHLYDVRG